MEIPGETKPTCRACRLRSSPANDDPCHSNGPETISPPPRGARASQTNASGAVVALIVALAFTGCDRTESDWIKAKQANTITAYKEFVSRHPQGARAEEAEQAMEAQRWSAAQAAGKDTAGKEDIEALESYLKDFPRGKHAAEVASKLQDAELAGADRQGTPDAYLAFHAKYPGAERLRVLTGRVSSAIVFLSDGKGFGMGCDVSVNDEDAGVAGGKDAVRWGLAEGDGIGSLSVKQIPHGRVISKKTGADWVIVAVQRQ